jgi:hypothetical protein
MQIRFSGITHYTASSQKAMAQHFDENILPTLPFHSIPASQGAEAVILTGKDADSVWKETFGIVIPEALQNVLEKNFPQMIAQVKEQYPDFLQQLLDLDLTGSDPKIFNYYKKIKQQGQDAEGNPIRFETVA